jgi:nucleotide-binding universal stress UspA family protein
VLPPGRRLCLHSLRRDTLKLGNARAKTRDFPLHPLLGLGRHAGPRCIVFVRGTEVNRARLAGGATMKRILVPLDMKTEPDAIARVVADAARGAGAAVRLLHVAPVPECVVDASGRLIAYATQEGAWLEAEALDYLRAVELEMDGIPVESAVRLGDPADEILAGADEFGADLIAFATPPERCLSRLALCGTVAQVWRRANSAVMVLRLPALFA